MKKYNIIAWLIIALAVVGIGATFINLAHVFEAIINYLGR